MQAWERCSDEWKCSKSCFDTFWLRPSASEKVCRRSRCRPLCPLVLGSYISVERNHCHVWCCSEPLLFFTYLKNMRVPVQRSGDADSSQIILWFLVVINIGYSVRRCGRHVTQSSARFNCLTSHSTHFEDALPGQSLGNEKKNKLW